jgi:hypothetical protein
MRWIAGFLLLISLGAHAALTAPASELIGKAVVDPRGRISGASGTS